MSKFNVLVDIYAVADTEPPPPPSPFLSKFTMYIILKGTRKNNFDTIIAKLN